MKLTVIDSMSGSAMAPVGKSHPFMESLNVPRICLPLREMTGVSSILILYCIGEKHQKTCGGTYIKIAEPEGYNNKKQQQKMSKSDSKSSLTDKDQTLDKFFKKSTENTKEEEKEVKSKPYVDRGKKRGKEEAGIGELTVQ
jgi:hypothetical protein